MRRETLTVIRYHCHQRAARLTPERESVCGNISR
jgi:hypothetical protein